MEPLDIWRAARDTVKQHGDMAVIERPRMAFRVRLQQRTWYGLADA
jgi:hypothetical protein